MVGIEDEGGGFIAEGGGDTAGGDDSLFEDVNHPCSVLNENTYEVMKINRTASNSISKLVKVTGTE